MAVGPLERRVCRSRHGVCYSLRLLRRPMARPSEFHIAMNALGHLCRIPNRFLKLDEDDDERWIYALWGQ